jgi:outer membrane protein assembly factor BamB
VDLSYHRPRMSAIHVVALTGNGRGTPPGPNPLYGLFDVIIDGVNVSARIGESQALALLADLGMAIADLQSGVRSRVVLQLYSAAETWELGIEADGPEALLTVYRTGNSPEVSIEERRIALQVLRDGVLNGLESAKVHPCPTAVRRALLASEQALRMSPATLVPPRRRTQEVAITPRPVRGLAFRADTRLRVVERAATTDQVERSDLHALLCHGSFGVSARGRTWKVPDASIFLVAERLLELAEAAVHAQQSACPLFRRVQVGNVRLGVRLAPADGPLAVSLGSTLAGQSPGVTFPELEPSVFAQSVIAFVASLHDAITRADPSQSQNLRLQTLNVAATRLAELCHPQHDQENLVNANPDAYRRFAVSASPTSGRWEKGAGLRFSLRFTASVPQIDLKSTVFCGDSLIVGSHRETSCLDPLTGATRWRVATARAATIGTPAGLVRLFPDGRLAGHDLDTGNPRFALRLTPRAQGGACGAVIFAPGLPRLLAICEGDRRVTAVDLVSGEVRWRYTARRPAPLRIRRAGRLLMVAGGDSVLVALDATTGDVVWRACDRLPFSGDISVVGNDVFAISGGAQGNAWLHAYDAWSGELKWRSEIEERPIHGQAPLVSCDHVLVAVRDSRGSGVRAFDRRDGAEAWKVETGYFPRAAAWLMAEDLLMVNGASGTFTCMEAATGALKYRHVFSHDLESDQPRRLEPVLRCGALFVPQHSVQAMRPTDGNIIGAVPSDLVPDLVRVDDRWGVLVAEESGHLSVFSVSPLLVRVK